ncbi:MULTISPECIES: thioesterase [unclassified Pseudomonas]|uniref:thioesterase II family protein n=1 Tax=unclassified Pseudomonas TaxID=196821 RepID=UPI001A9DFCB1|nr:MULTISPECIES: thioesterase [unclassified Pseudomonas]MCE5991373.1 thioesterase domain-containing protein [Pseudomonas sp. KCA11]UMY62296.1 thioesterase domain-containing protein [Pseudomonas sp. LS.1a]
MRACNTQKSIVFIPFAGGSSRAFKALQSTLSPGVDCIDIHYSGRYQGALAPSPTTVGHMANEVIEHLHKSRPAQVVLFGYSLGALVAYEVAQRQAAMPWAITELVVAACRPPHLFSCHGVRVHDEDDDFLDSIATFGTVPPYLYSNPAARKYLLPNLRNDFRAASTYCHRPRPQLNTPLTAIAGAQDSFAPFAEVRAWRQYSNGRFSEHCLPGRHFFYQTQTDRLSEILLDALAA